MHLKTKIKDCESFAKDCEKWKKDCELQLKQINDIMEQNANFLETCKKIMSCEDKQHVSVNRELVFEASQITEPGTPPTPSIDCSESQNILTNFSLSPALVHHKDINDQYTTPTKKAVSIRVDKNTTKKISLDSVDDNDDDDEDDDDDMLNKLCDPNIDKEYNLPKIKRKRQRTKK